MTPRRGWIRSGRPAGAVIALALCAGCGNRVAPRDGGTLQDVEGGVALDLTWSPPDLTGCVGLRCQRVSCGDGFTTIITGKVSIPSGEVPLDDVIVYIPDRPDQVKPFAKNLHCESCEDQLSGDPLVMARTDPNGKFTLEDVPAGDDIPIVIQVGRWRRTLIIPTVTPCDVTVLPDKLLRMPATKSQGDIPQIALVTSTYDALECLLLKIGLDRAEFTANTDGGRVHLYRSTGSDLTPPVPPASALEDDLRTMERYDMIILPCEGMPIPRSRQRLDNLAAFAEDGGRVLATHYSYVWLADNNTPLHLAADWQPDQAAPSPNPFHALIDQTSLQGRNYAKWLKNTGASTVLGQIDIADARRDFNRVQAGLARLWMSGDNIRNGSQDVPLQMSFNTPINLHPPDLSAASLDGGAPDGGAGPLQCGRVGYADFHVSIASVDGKQRVFPANCVAGALTAQAKALVYMLFNLSACAAPGQ